MSLSTIRLPFLLLLTAIIGHVVIAQHEDTIEEQLTFWNQFFNRITSTGLENIRRRLPALIPPPQTEEYLTSEATTTTSDQFIFPEQEIVQLPHQPPIQELTREGSRVNRDLNRTTIDDASSANRPPPHPIIIVSNEADNATIDSNVMDNLPNDADSNNATLTKSDVDNDDRNETNTTASPISSGDPKNREEPKRLFLQQTDSGTPGTTFNLNANSNSNSDPNISNGFNPSNFIAGLGPLVLPLIYTVGDSLSQHHIEVIEEQKKRLAVLNAPRPYLPTDEELPGFGTALFNELVQNRRPGGFGSALANDLARSEQSSNDIQVAKLSPPIAYPLRKRPSVKGLPVYPRFSAGSSSTLTVPSRRVGSPSPRRRFSIVPESIRKYKVPQESIQTDANQVGTANRNWNPIAQNFERSSAAAGTRPTLNEIGGRSAFPEIPSYVPKAIDVEQDQQFSGTANDRKIGPTEDNSFGAAFPDYSNLPGSSIIKDNSFSGPSFGEQPRNYDRHQSSNHEYESYDFPRQSPDAFRSRQETTLRGSSAATSAPSFTDQLPPLFPDTFSLRTDNGADDQAPDFVAGTGLVAPDRPTRGPPPGVFGSGRQPDESFFDSV